MKFIHGVFPARSYLGWCDPTRQRRSFGIAQKKKKRQKNPPEVL